MGLFRFMSAALVGCALAIPVTWATASPKVPAKQEEKLVCDKKENIAKTFEDKKFFSLLNMTNENKVVETVWISGTTIAITAAVPDNDQVCLLAMMSDVVYNSDTIQGLNKVFEQQLNKEKGI